MPTATSPPPPPRSGTSADRRRRPAPCRGSWNSEASRRIGAKCVESRAQVGVAIAEVAPEGDRDARNGLLLPARRQDRADTLGANRSTSDDVLEAGGGLLEQTLVLHRLTEHDTEHRPMARVGDRGNPRPPALDEGRQMTSIVLEDAAVAPPSAFLLAWCSGRESRSRPTASARPVPRAPSAATRDASPRGR